MGARLRRRTELSNDYRLPIKLEDTTDDLGNQYTSLLFYGRPFAVLMRDFQRNEPSYVYSGYDYLSGRWSLTLDLKEIPPAPKPKPKRKRKLSDLGLRRPK